MNQMCRVLQFSVFYSVNVDVLVVLIGNSRPNLTAFYYSEPEN